MSADLIFEDPLPAARSGSRAGESPLGLWLAALRDHPGQWAKYADAMSAATCTVIRQGKRHGVKPGEFEVRQVAVGDTRKVWLYARYVGTPDLRAVEAS